jgi:hypothetical protein
MGISSSDIKVKLSTKSGAAGNTETSAPADSLGKYVSTTELVDATLHNLFDLVSGAENLDEEAEYRCIFIHNTNGTDTFLNIKIFLLSQVTGGADVELGIDTTAASAVGSGTAQALEVADEDTAPVGVTFSAPADYAAGLDLGDLAPAEVRAVWVKRLTKNSASLTADGATIRIQGESL